MSPTEMVALKCLGIFRRGVNKGVLEFAGMLVSLFDAKIISLRVQAS